MLKFELEVISYGDKNMIQGFSRGHMTITGNQTLVTSKGSQPDQSMMIFLSLVELLDGMRRFITYKNVSRYDFIGIDSSFQFSVIQLAEGHFRLTDNGRTIAEIQTSEMIQAVWDGVSAFLSRYLDAIKPDDPIAGDLHSAVESFKSAFNIHN